MRIRDRIKELRRVKASELIPNPKNWRTQPGLYPTPQKKTESELRRRQMLELYKGGATEGRIARTLGVSRAVVRRDIKRALSDLAKMPDLVERSLMVEFFEALKDAKT